MLGKHIPGIAEVLDCLSSGPHRTLWHIVEGHRAPLLPDSSHHGGGWHDVLFDATAVQAPTDPDVIHIKRTRRRTRIIPKRRIEETRLNKITRGPRDYGHGFRFSNLIGSKQFRHEPNEIVRH